VQQEEDMDFEPLQGKDVGVVVSISNFFLKHLGRPIGHGSRGKYHILAQA
jgi:hypothetical protein